MGKDSSRDGKWKKENVFEFYILDEDGTLNLFETSSPKTTAPNLVIDQFRTDPTMVKGIIKRIHYRFNPTNAATFILRIWKAAGVVNPYIINLGLLYESPALQADDVDYDRAELEIPMVLYTPGELLYSIEWSAAPGNTQGFISVSGVKHE